MVTAENRSTAARSSACRQRRRRDRRHADIRSPAAKARACAAGSSLNTVAPRHVALRKTHAFAVLEIDGGKENHGATSKIGDQRQPERWLFSGWNWVPTYCRLPTIAVTGPP
jgi:hypothetical protein